jgi:hypothetical protein
VNITNSSQMMYVCRPVVVAVCLMTRFFVNSQFGIAPSGACSSLLSTDVRNLHPYSCGLKSIWLMMIYSRTWDKFERYTLRATKNDRVDVLCEICEMWCNIKYNLFIICSSLSVIVVVIIVFLIIK